MYGTVVIISVGNTGLCLAQKCPDHPGLRGTGGRLYIAGCFRLNVGRNRCVCVCSVTFEFAGKVGCINIEGLVQ